jgi:2-polyprenyl-3-methyl-5-hydroxy-6-metoxy-1,4-benzoquinol methylase
VLRLLPTRRERVLDVGCGDGSFAVELAARCGSVVALDVDLQQVSVARERCAALSNVTVQQGDFLALRGEEQYDVVTALASFHHMPFAAAAAQARAVVRPGGRLVVLGLWTDTGRRDLPWNVASIVLNLALKALRGPDAMDAPAMMPTMTLPELRRAVAAELPGAVLRRRLLWRYTLVWDKH